MVLLVVPNETGELELYINLETLNRNLGWGGGVILPPPVGFPLITQKR